MLKEARVEFDQKTAKIQPVIQHELIAL